MLEKLVGQTTPTFVDGVQLNLVCLVDITCQCSTKILFFWLSSQSVELRAFGIGDV